MSDRLLLFVGVSHRRMPLALRERCAVPAHERVRVRADLQRRLGYPVVLVSTCGRVEFYVDVDRTEADRIEQAARAWFGDGDAGDGPIPAGYVESARGDGALRRLVRVACGLESALEGEDEILGQVRRAWLDASLAGALSPALDAAFRLAVRAGRRARRIGGGDAWTSLAEAAAARVARAVERQASPRVAVAGTGPMGLRAAQALRARFGDALALALVGRTPERVAGHAARLGARPLVLAALPEALDWADAAVVGLRTRAPLIAPSCLTARTVERPLLIADLSLPRAVDPTVGALPNVALLDTDLLAGNGCGQSRWTAAERLVVERLVEEAASEYEGVVGRTDAAATLAALRLRADAIRRARLERTLRRLPDLDAEARWTLDALTRAIVNRLLHAPTMQLKGERADDVAAAVRQIFELG